MRAVFLFVVVALTSVALADEDIFAPATEAPTAEAATVADDTPSILDAGESSAVTYPATTAPQIATADASADANAANGKTTIALTGNQVIFNYGQGRPVLQIAPGAKAVIVCNAFTFSNAPGERPKLHCQQCEFTLPNGSTGEAADVTYDTATKMLTLTGTDDQPVKLASNRDGGGQKIKAPKMEIELDFATPQSLPVPAAYIETGDRYTPATTVNPIHRTDKALIAD
jgi:hypothetical protein